MNTEAHWYASLQCLIEEADPNDRDAYCYHYDRASDPLSLLRGPFLWLHEFWDWIWFRFFCHRYTGFFAWLAEATGWDYLGGQGDCCWQGWLGMWRREALARKKRAKALGKP